MKKILVLLSCLMFIALTPVVSVSAEETKFTSTKETILNNNDEGIDDIDKVFFIHLVADSEFFKEIKKSGIEYVVLTDIISPFLKNFNHFKSISWIQRDGKMSLSLEPTQPFNINKDAAWSEAVRFFQNHPIYREVSNSSKYNSMYNQFVCHVDFARGFKTPWNIEPWKSDKGYAGFAASGCN